MTGVLTNMAAMRHEYGALPAGRGHGKKGMFSVPQQSLRLVAAIGEHRSIVPPLLSLTQTCLLVF